VKQIQKRPFSQGKNNLAELLVLLLKQWIIGGLSFRGNSAEEIQTNIEQIPTKCPSRLVKLDTRRK